MAFKMVGLLLGGLWIGWGIVVLRWKLQHSQKSESEINRTGTARLLGDVSHVQVARPNYTKKTRVGTRIQFDLNVCNLGDGATTIVDASVICAFTLHEPTWIGFKLYDHIGQGNYQQKLRAFDYKYVYELGKWVTFPFTVYFDEFPPESYTLNSLTVQLTDERNQVHIFTIQQKL